MITAQITQAKRTDTALRTKVLKVISESKNGIRLRHIGSSVGEWHPYLRLLVDDLVSEGKVVETFHRDNANMDSYYLYSIKK